MEEIKTTEEKVKEIVAQTLHLDADKIDLSTTWKDLGADSLDLVQIIVSIEDQFKIEIPDEDSRNLSTFGDMVKYIEAHQAQ